MRERGEADGGVASFFHVRLECGAAPHLGCGTRSRPILLELEGERSIREAWLNRQGTVLAVVWSELSESGAGIELVISTA